FPDVANHVNVEIACNLLLIVAIGYSIAHRERYPTDDDCFELVRPVLQVTMIAIYVMAGFAKLNTDFLNPAVSCVGNMMHDLGTVHGPDDQRRGAAAAEPDDAADLRVLRDQRARGGTLRVGREVAGRDPLQSGRAGHAVARAPFPGRAGSEAYLARRPHREPA